jgi:S-(hydroxymethyl)glutathione dehydrogenase/alcohol dehydrogenase
MSTLAPAAVLYEAKKPLRIEEVRVLPPQKGEVTVRMKAAGVCHSDLHVMKGDLSMPMPIILGHEGSGVIEAVGEGVTDVEVGRSCDPRLARLLREMRVLQQRPPRAVRHGHAMRFTGLMPDGTTRFQNSAGESIRHYAGVSAFSSLSTMPQASVVKIPKEFSFEKAALIGCGVITGVGAVERAAKVQPNSTVAVIGCGGIGLNVIQGARMAGARQIIAVDKFTRKEGRRTAVRRHGLRRCERRRSRAGHQRPHRRQRRRLCL